MYKYTDFDSMEVHKIPKIHVHEHIVANKKGC